MTAPAPQCQPSIECPNSDLSIEWLTGLAEKGGKGVVNNIDARSLGRISGELEAWKSSHAALKADLAQCTEANHHYRDAVDLLESNARVQANLLADTGRRVKELEGALQLLWAETIASGNADAKDYGWPKARAATLAALSPKPAGETGR